MSTDFPTPAELVEQVRAGNRIVHMSPTLFDARAALDAVAAAAGPLQESDRVFRAVGRELYAHGHSGGRIIFTSIGSERVRGLDGIDRVVLDVDADIALSDRVVDNLDVLQACGATLVRR